jgi:hypothetical protein
MTAAIEGGGGGGGEVAGIVCCMNLLPFMLPVLLVMFKFTLVLFKVFFFFNVLDSSGFLDRLAFSPIDLIRFDLTG